MKANRLLDINLHQVNPKTFKTHEAHTSPLALSIGPRLELLERPLDPFDANDPCPQPDNPGDDPAPNCGFRTNTVALFSHCASRSCAPSSICGRSTGTCTEVGLALRSICSNCESLRGHDRDGDRDGDGDGDGGSSDREERGLERRNTFRDDFRCCSDGDDDEAREDPRLWLL